MRPTGRPSSGPSGQCRRKALIAGSSAALLMIIGFCGESGSAGDEPARGLARVGSVLHAPVKEASALVASRRHDGVLWTLCDSRNRAQLYAIDRSGRLLGEFEVEGGVNLDWESLSIDDAGRLYIADVGNNLRVPMRWVYQVAEPDVAQPEEPAETVDRDPEPVKGSVRVEKAFAYTFPGEPFDVEGTFIHGKSLYLVSKEREHAGLWSLPIAESGPVELTMVCELRDVDRATGADVSPDGSELMICTYTQVILYRLSVGAEGSLHPERAADIPFRAGGVEGCCWSGDEMLLISEDRSIYGLARPPAQPSLKAD